jgi:predicted DNA-binding transcriptional regulator AlpA
MVLLVAMVTDFIFPFCASYHDMLGVGKSTLLRHIAMREVPIPAHITILFVEQEVSQVTSAKLASNSIFLRLLAMKHLQLIPS